MTAVLDLPGRYVPVDDPLIAGIQVLPEHAPNAERPRIGIPHVSPSQFSAYFRCSAAYYLKYGLDKKEARTSALVFGTAEHATAHAFLDARLYATSDPVAAAMAALREHLAKNPIDIWSNSYDKGPLDNDETFLPALIHGFELLQPHLEAMRPRALEQGYLVHWRDQSALPVVGYGDFINERGPDEDEIVDLKTGTKAKSENDLEYNTATKFYAACHERATGRKTRHRRFLSLARNKEPKVASIELLSDEPFSFDRIYSLAKMLTAARENGVYGAWENAQTCKSCTLTTHCTQTFGKR